ncbi:MAG: hypothetical protein A2469_02410 [Candidatus Magasanikbacteria bacterium RIFOXYC2_FULL_40_16]|uniref:Proline--tRNA ligase n=3 Tax=Candidatus Magasanikiibacteriota TaxID=1752731 RepID=A0A1F6NJ74_9BACT|nr:MAG: hypothetical protein A2224_01560 [Candidatus Magasanikbacteria bacterium RIFOXYA2_FULL_40_20]OGH83865.1 MAG: hypothetical protein A2373_01975 [Candidatus Magasanikbacteria bacterium RIFOXYB1_FULL_40_15]OGH86339.1 MAG: hypothetical protein A2301_00025 [Candidatus Magasanikbacteria bacterium RIFOXYB2_FULL_40_13]OGH87136.1 MAG: hypothetical protein A2206_00665 [Candidatus Magasanikbacteria bacterium RIFOXYA1_FULL_40_8]OGH89648.1 MAG: hypothetical protein A2469_02410 [Candidatus Magasanikba
MRQSKLFTKTAKETPKDEVSINAQLLIRAGFIDKLMAGVYTYLPLGLRSLEKIKKIVREEMNQLGGQEILMPALTPKEIWEVTGRWDKIDVAFKLDGDGGKQYSLGSTHEEVVTPLVKKFVKSYKDLPVAVYQIQDKFRNEPRAKSGLLRGREFSMKDLYSFHKDEEDFSDFYEKSKQAYLNIFEKCGLNAVIAEADGGVFTDKYSHEFQVFTENGEDIIFSCETCGLHRNSEIVKEEKCPQCGGGMVKNKAIEVGNIFPLETRFSDAFGFSYLDKDGKEQPVLMGCYGIGPSRVMGSIVEVNHDEKGIIWPESVAPYSVHLVSLCKESADIKKADELYETLTKQGVEVLYDDREGATAGQKFADSDLVGLPKRVVISPKTLAEDSVEIKERSSDKVEIIKIKELNSRLF